MIINNEAAVNRLNSPMNLINRLKNTTSRKSAMNLFGVGRSADKKIEIIKPIFNPFAENKIEQPKLPALIPSQAASQIVEPTTTLDRILENNESQIKLGLAHDNALALLNRSVDMLATKLDDIRADRLPQVVSAASKVVEGIRRERNESTKNNSNKEVHYHFYTPEQKSIKDYEVIDVA